MSGRAKGVSKIGVTPFCMLIIALAFVDTFCSAYGIRPAEQDYDHHSLLDYIPSKQGTVGNSLWLGLK
jgi:hypothetical protein